MDFANIPTVTFEELTYAYQVGASAALGKIPNSGVEGMGVNIEMDEGDVQRFELTDKPINRAMIAIRDQFPEGQLMPLMMRIWEIQELADDDRMKPYIRELEDGEAEIYEAVFHTAAEMPFSKKGKFKKQQFFRRLKSLAKKIDDEEIESLV